MPEDSNFPVYDIPRERAVREQLADLSYAQQQALAPVQNHLAVEFGNAHDYQQKTLSAIQRRIANNLTKLSQAQYDLLSPIEQSLVNRLATLSGEQLVLAQALPPVPQPAPIGIQVPIPPAQPARGCPDGISIGGLPENLKGMIPREPTPNVVIRIGEYICQSNDTGCVWMCWPYSPPSQGEPAFPPQEPLPPHPLPPQQPIPPQPPFVPGPLFPPVVPGIPVLPAPEPEPQPQPQPQPIPQPAPVIPVVPVIPAPVIPPPIFPPLPQPQPPRPQPPPQPQPTPEPAPIDEETGCAIMDEEPLPAPVCSRRYPQIALPGGIAVEGELDLCDDVML